MLLLIYMILGLLVLCDYAGPLILWYSEAVWAFGVYYSYQQLSRYLWQLWCHAFAYTTSLCHNIHVLFISRGSCPWVLWIKVYRFLRNDKTWHLHLHTHSFIIIILAYRYKTQNLLGIPFATSGTLSIQPDFLTPVSHQEQSEETDGWVRIESGCTPRRYGKHGS